MLDDGQRLVAYLRVQQLEAYLPDVEHGATVVQ